MGRDLVWLGRILTCRYARAVQADLAADQAIGDGMDNQPREFLRLRALANALTVLLIGTVTLTAGRLAMPMLDRGTPAWEVNIDVRPFVVLSRVSVAVAGIVFLIWFRRARINAEGHGWHQRFARAWTFWGWIVPVVNLWIPLQVMDDIWQASFPRRSRTWIAWLPMLWWTSWVLSEGLLVLQGGAVVALEIWIVPQPGSAPPASYGTRLPDSWPSFFLFAVAGLTLTAIIRAVSSGPVGTPIAPIQSESNTAKQ